MELNKLVGMLCIAANKAGVELTAWEIYRLANALESELAMDAKTDIPAEIQAKEKAREPKIKVYEESIPMTDGMMKLAIEHLKNVPVPPEIKEMLKKAQDTATHSKIESVDAPAETPADSKMEPVKKPEQPKPDAPAKDSKPKTKPRASGTALSPREQQMWDYIQAHPNASMEETCNGMGIKKANYHWIRNNLKNKGYIITAREDTAKIRAVQKRFKIVTAEEQSEMDKRMEDAYMGEHPNIQPAPVPKRPVSKQARRLYEYMQSHPDSRMPKTCEDLNITNADYYMLKAALKRNGWIEDAVENVKAY